MSLINDALKRAQAEKSQSGAAYEPPVPAPSRGGGGTSRKGLVVLGAVIVIGMGVAAWQLWLKGRTAVPGSAAAAVAQPSALPSPSARAATPKPSPAANDDPELLAIIAKSLRAVNTYHAPEAVAEPPFAPEDFPDTYMEDALEASVAAASAAPKAAAAATPSPSPSVRPVPPFDDSQYKVSAILMDDEGGQAVINGRIVRVGDTIDGAKVLKIEGKSVRVEVNGQVQSLRS